jgi:hypothetical protein
MQACAVSDRLSQLGGAHALPGARNLDVGGVTGIGRRSALERTAHFFMELADRSSEPPATSRGGL